MTDPSPEDLSSAMQDYLETIHSLTEESGAARVRDIAQRLGVGMPAVTNALHAMSEKQLVDYEPYQLVQLTEQGQVVAEEVHRRHRELVRFLTAILGVGDETAEANACRIEHDIDVSVLRRMALLAEFLETQPGFERDAWLERFEQFCSDHSPPRAG